MNKSFLLKLAVTLFLLAVVCSVAGYTSRYVWMAMFESLKYNITDFSTLGSENQTMKTQLNLMMYAMPLGFIFVSVGFLVSSLLAYGLAGVVTRASHNSGCKDGQHE